MDGHIGQILDTLEKKGVLEDTAIIVTSDHGENQGELGIYGEHATADHITCRIPMIVRWPGKVEPGIETDALVEYCDVTPTLVEAAGGTPDPALDGESFLQVLLGKTDHHKDYTYGIMTTRGIINGNECYPIRSVRNDKYRLIWNLNWKVPFQNACTRSRDFQSMLEAAAAGDPRAKRVTDDYRHRPEWELYDVVADPLEMNNLAEEPKYADTVRQLKAQLDAWMRSQGDLGIATEMDAKNHQRRGRRAKKRPAK
jgi:uncharacterized sulfatase